MSKRSTDSASERKPASPLEVLAREYGGVSKIPGEVLDGIGYKAVTEVMRGRRITRVVRVEPEAKPAVEADSKPKYPTTELSSGTKTTLGALTRLAGEYGVSLNRGTTDPPGERDVTVGTHRGNGNQIAKVTDTTYPDRHYETTVERDLEFSADGSTVFAASITTTKPTRGQYGTVREPKVTEIAPEGLEGFAADMLETVQQEMAIDAKIIR